MKKYLTTLLVAVYVLIANAADDPTTFTFTGNVNDSWIVTENWTPFYPGTQIIEGDLIVIDADCRATAGDVEIGGGLIINSGVAFNTNGADVTIVGSAIVHGILNVANSSTFQNDGLTSVEAGGAIMNDGTVASNADFHVEGSIQNDGDWQNGGFSDMQIVGAGQLRNNDNLDNYGTLYYGGFSLVNNSNLGNLGDLIVDASMSNRGNISNQGTLTVTEELNNMSGGVLSNSAFLEVEPGGSITNFGAVYNFKFGYFANIGNLSNGDQGFIYNEGNFSSVGGENLSLLSGSLFENKLTGTVTIE